MRRKKATNRHMEKNVSRHQRGSTIRVVRPWRKRVVEKSFKDTSAAHPSNCWLIGIHNKRIRQRNKDRFSATTWNWIFVQNDLTNNLEPVLEPIRRRKCSKIVFGLQLSH